MLMFEGQLIWSQDSFFLFFFLLHLKRLCGNSVLLNCGTFLFMEMLSGQTTSKMDGTRNHF